jgi:hypothetical protein
MTLPQWGKLQSPRMHTENTENTEKLSGLIVNLVVNLFPEEGVEIAQNFAEKQFEYLTLLD